jgi:glycogen(starch) synthase
VRVLIWAIPYLPVAGGREVFASRLATRLSARGHDVVVVAPEHSGGPIQSDATSGFPVVRIPVGGLIDAHQLTGLRLPTDLGAAGERLDDVLAGFRPDVVHAHALAPDLILLGPRARASGVPILVTDHSVGALPAVAALAVTQRVSRIPQHVAAVSAALADGLARSLPAVEDRLSVIRNGVPLPERTSPVDPHGPVVLLGRVSPEKGFAAAMTAWSVVARGRAGRELVVAGNGPDLSALRGLAEHLAIAEQVRFAGWLDQDAVSALLDRAALVVVPSLWDEPFGLVAAEAAAHGRPVVASRAGGLPEVVVDGRTGWLVDPGDILRLVGALRVLDDPARLAAAGVAAREHARAALDFERCVDEYLLRYERLVAS